jgi:uncharacterized membrane-anchored protein YitT (DUF2179 family)
LKIKNLSFILFGAILFAFGIVHFNIQNKLAEGGITGITLILYFLWNWSPSITNLILNIPIFAVGWKYLGRNTFMYSVFGTVAVSLFLAIFQVYQLKFFLQEDMILAAVFAGVFIGIGLGIIFRFGGTTGGVDIIARIFQRFFGWSIGRTILGIDIFVIGISLVYLNVVQAMYTLIAVYIGTRVIDFIQEGAYSARGLLIISDSYDKIATCIHEEMGRGVTVLRGYGSYTKNEKNVLYCVISKREVVRLKNIITDIDPHAFVSSTVVNEVLGEGFTLDENRKPIHQ